MLPLFRGSRGLATPLRRRERNAERAKATAASNLSPATPHDKTRLKPQQQQPVVAPPTPRDALLPRLAKQVDGATATTIAAASRRAAPVEGTSQLRAALADTKAILASLEKRVQTEQFLRDFGLKEATLLLNAIDETHDALEGTLSQLRAQPDNRAADVLAQVDRELTLDDAEVAGRLTGKLALLMHNQLSRCLRMVSDLSILCTTGALSGAGVEHLQRCIRHAAECLLNDGRERPLKPADPVSVNSDASAQREPAEHPTVALPEGSPGKLPKEALAAPMVASVSASPTLDESPVALVLSSPAATLCPLPSKDATAPILPPSHCAAPLPSRRPPPLLPLPSSPERDPPTRAPRSVAAPCGRGAYEVSEKVAHC